MEFELVVLGLASLLVIVCLLTPLSSALKVPFTLALSVAGAALGYLIHVHTWAPGWLDKFLVALTAFEVPSDTILIVFLPVLLFESALAMNFRRLMNDIGPVMVMAVVAVFVCTLFIGLGVSLVTTQSLAACLLMGAIVATTDPAAVVGIFKEVGAPKRLTLIVEGESLLNDAAAIALYTVLIGIVARGTEIHWNLAPLFLNFGMLLFGGALTGYIIGRLACAGFSLLRGRPTAEISLTVATAYIAYIVAELYVGVSGVVSTVAAGLVVSTIGRTRVTTATFGLFSQAWSQLGFWASSLVFLMASMTIPRLMATVSWQDVLVVVIMMVAALIARFVAVFGVMPLASKGASARVSQAYKTVIWWGGLRGAISLALALSVTEHPSLPEEVRRFVAVGATGFVLTTLLVNGLTLRILIRLLGLNVLSNAEQVLRNQASMVTTTGLKREIDTLATDEQISEQAREVVRDVYKDRLSQKQSQHPPSLDVSAQLRLGLEILARREFELLFTRPREHGVDASTIDRLLGFAQRAEDAARIDGPAGYERVFERALRYPAVLRALLRFHQRTGMPRWLGNKLGQRFVLLWVMRVETRRLIQFTHQQLSALIDEGPVTEIDAILEQRLIRIEENLLAMRLQFPQYAIWLEQAYLGRAAQSLERVRYRELLQDSLISSEVYETLLDEAQQSWAFLDNVPTVDLEKSTLDMLKGIAAFADLSDMQLQTVARCFTARHIDPDAWIVSPDGVVEPLYLIVSGAVSLRLADASRLELGSGDYFGSGLLLADASVPREVHSLGYTKLFVATAKSFHAVLDRDPQLRQIIEPRLNQPSVSA